MTRTETRGCTVTDYAPDDEHDDFQDGGLEGVDEVAKRKPLLSHASDDETEHDAEDDQTQHVRVARLHDGETRDALVLD